MQAFYSVQGLFIPLRRLLPGQGHDPVHRGALSEKVHRNNRPGDRRNIAAVISGCMGWCNLSRSIILRMSGIDSGTGIGFGNNLIFIRS
jgi:hypothetical protein